MKKIISFITLLAMVSQFTFAVSAANEPVPVATDDIATLEVGDDYSLKGAYKRTEPQSEGVCTVEYNDEIGKYLYFDGTSFSGTLAETGIKVPVTNGTGVLTVKFDYKIERGHTKGVHFYCGRTVQMELSESPVVMYEVNRELNYYSPTGKITPGSWHEITAVLRTSNKTFDFYVNGVKIVDNQKFRKEDASSVSDVSLFMNNSYKAEKKFSVANIKVYRGDYTPAKFTNDYIEATTLSAEKRLTDLTTSAVTVKNALPNAYAMFEGYTYGYSAGKYEAISSDEHLAPVLNDGTVFAPASYVAKALGGTYSEGTINAGGQTFEFVEGATSSICEKAPVMVGNELYIPVTNNLASYFGSSAFVDDRGMAIIGISQTPGEQVIRSLLFELRNYSAVFGEGVKSEVLFCSRNWRDSKPEQKGRYNSIDATKRFMSTSNRWTYLTDENVINRFRDLGSVVQSTLNAVPVTVKKDATTGATITCDHANGCIEPWYEGSVVNFDGTLYVRSDGLHGWGCTNNEQFLNDLKRKAEQGIDMGQYLWQFDDQSLNSREGCYCTHCMTEFTAWLKEQGCTTYNDLYTKYQAAGTSSSSTSISNFNYETYLRSNEGFTTNSEVNSYYQSETRMGKAYKEFSTQKVMEFHEELREYMDDYAAKKGLKIFMSCNNSNTGGNVKSRADYNHIMDGGIGESNPQNTNASGVYATRFSDQAFDSPFVSSLSVKQGKTTMQLWESSIPLMYATGQAGLVPWDSWVVSNSRFYCTTEELAGNYAFVRENSDLFDNYEAPEEVGYILDLDHNDGIAEWAIKNLAGALGRKGVASRVIGVRGDTQPYLTVDAKDLEGLKAIVKVNSPALTSQEEAVIAATGITPVSYTYATYTLMNVLTPEGEYWTAKVEDMPDDCYAVLRKNSIYENAPVVVHAVNFASANKKNVNILVNNNHLPEGDSFTVKFHSPQNNTYTKEVTKGGSGVTTITIPELDNWTVMEIWGDNTQSVSRFDVDGMSGMGLGSRVSYDSAEGTEKDFTITTYGEGINVYTLGDEKAGQDEAGYVYKYVTNDDFEVTAQVSSENGEAGLMVREDIYSNSASVTLSYSFDEGLRFGKRQETDMPMMFKEFDGGMPEYIKLSFKNNRVTASISEDGAKWTELGSENIFFEPMTAGVFAASADGTKTRCYVKGFDLSGTDNVLQSSLKSINLMEGRNPSFMDLSLLNIKSLMDYSAGFDGIWKASYTLINRVQSINETNTVVTRLANQSADDVRGSVKLTGRSSGEEGLWYRFLPIENGKTYEVSCWAKVDSGVNATGSIVVQKPKDGANSDGGLDSSREYTGTVDFSSIVDYDGSAALSDKWTRVYTRFTVPATGHAAGADIRFKTDTACIVYLDNFEMREVHSIGDNFNAVVVEYDTHAVFEISTKDGSTETIRYTAIVKKPDRLGNEHIVSMDTKTIEVTDATTSIDVPINSLGSYAEIYLWDAATNEPISRTIKIRKTL